MKVLSPKCTWPGQYLKWRENDIHTLYIHNPCFGGVKPDAVEGCMGYKWTVVGGDKGLDWVERAKGQQIWQKATTRHSEAL